MALTPQATAVLLVVALLLAAGALGAGIMALSGQRRVREAYQRFSRGSDADVLTLLRRHIDEVEALRADVAGLRGYADEIRELHRSAVSRVGSVRYDAFDDMGGRLSFSTALLDEQGDGVLITAINGRIDTRLYTKPVTAGTSRHNLSAEERAAITRAMNPARPRDSHYEREPAVQRVDEATAEVAPPRHAAAAEPASPSAGQELPEPPPGAER